MKRISVIILLTIASVLIMFAACVSNQAPGTGVPTAGKPLVKRLPAGVEGVELGGGTVRLRPGYQFVKQTNGTITVARMSGLGVGGSWSCDCYGPPGGPAGKGNCGSTVSGGTLQCTKGTCNGSCELTVTTKPGKATAIIAY
jgi:hypothetical protein